MSTAVHKPNWRRFAVVLGMVAVAGLLVPQVANRGLIFIAGLLCVNMVFAMAFNLLFRTSGILSFGQAMFYAAGSYLFALLNLRAPDTPFLLVLLLACVAGALLAVVVGIVALRRTEGVYFAILTLAFAELIRVLISKSHFLGRDDGMTGITRPRINFGLFQIDLASGDSYYYFLLVASLAAVVLLWVIVHGTFGQALTAIRQDAQRAAFLGIPVQRYRLAAFAVSGSFSALAGAMAAPWIQIVTPEAAHWLNSTLPMLATLLGGSAYFWGPAVGALILSWLGYATRSMAGVADAVSGGLLLFVVLALPGGVLGLVLRRRKGRMKEAR